MDYLSVLEISGSGMELQQQRLRTMALNIANSQSAAPNLESVYQPVDVVVSSAIGDFDSHLERTGTTDVNYEVVPTQVNPRLVYEPAHPYANVDGYVAYPNVDPVAEMIKLMTATRSYEANAQVVGATKTMVRSALEIGR